MPRFQDSGSVVVATDSTPLKEDPVGSLRDRMEADLKVGRLTASLRSGLR